MKYERNRKREKRHREDTDPTVTKERQCQRIDGDHAEKTKHRERKACGERRSPEHGEGGGGQVLVEPRGPPPHVVGAVFPTQLLGDDVFSVEGRGHAPVQNAAAEKRGLGLVDPEEALVEGEEDE